MREILFRGKCKDTGEWYEGQYIHLHKSTYCFKEDYDRHPDNDIHQIVYEIMSDWGLPNRHFRVDVLPETVGQYTGLTDKNGKKIFEGDIVKHFDNSDKEYDIGVIYFDTEFMGWRRTTQGRFHKRIIDTYKLNPTCIYEVIGNIQDNPELLKEGADNG